MVRMMKRRTLSLVLVGMVGMLVAAGLAQLVAPTAEPAGRAGNARNRNVIFFHPDGYGLSHWNALRVYLVGPDGRLNWDRLPYMAPYTGHTRDAVTGTSQGNATVHAYGVKVAWNSFGLDGQQVITALSGKQMSIMREAMQAGFATALVNSASLSDPGTAAFIASVEGWHMHEAEIARQVIESGVYVMLSGGERWLLPEGVTGRHGVGMRKDGVNLIARARELGYTVVFTRDELMEVAADRDITKVLGVFAHGNTFNDLTEERLRAEGLPLYWPGAPTIAEMSAAALEILSRNPKAAERGIFLVAEEEGTDNFPNNANARGSFEAGRRADEAFGVFVEFVANNPNTLLITTADSNAAGKQISGLDLQTMVRFRAVVDGRVTKTPINTVGGEWVLAPGDGVDGAFTAPFMSAPDRAGNRLPFIVGWATSQDVVGDVLVRAKGLNAERVAHLGIVDNTDMYRIMYYTLFDRWLPGPIGVAPEPVTLTIVHTGDMHGHLDPFTPRGAPEARGGIARTATLVERIRAENPNTILLDAGDTMHGTNLANLFEGESVIAAMNAIGYSAMAVGNHDFNFRLGVLEERVEQANFPILAANVRYKTGEAVPFLKPYVRVGAGGLEIGIIGLVTTYTPIVTHPRNVEDLKFLDMAKVARELVEQLEPQVDLIFVVAHLASKAEEEALLKVPGIAVLVSELTGERVMQIGDTILVDSGTLGKSLGRLDIVVEEGKITGFRHEFLPITPAIEADAAVNAILSPFRAAIGGKLAEVVGEAAVVLDGERADIRTRETNLGNLVADILRARTGADIAIQNGGGIRTSIGVGPITLEEIFTVLPFDNYVVALELTGEKILAALENSVSMYPELHGRFPQVSGMSFLFDPAQPAGNRIVEVTIGGKPLVLDRTYIVATNDFMAGGGDGYTMLKEARVVLETGDFLRDAVAAYIAAHSPVAPQVEGRIRRR